MRLRRALHVLAVLLSAGLGGSSATMAQPRPIIVPSNEELSLPPASFLGQDIHRRVPLEVRAQAWQWLLWERIDQLQLLYDSVRQPALRDSAGRSLLAEFRSGVRSVMQGLPGTGERYRKELLAHLRARAQSRPDDALAQLLLAEVLMVDAWRTRGSSVYRQVPEASRKEFNATTAQALDHLTRHTELLRPHLTAQLLTIEIGMAQGWPKARMMDVAEAASRLDPASDSVHLLMVTALLPRWGGDSGEVERYIERVSSRLPGSEGDIRYARLAAALSDVQDGDRLFEGRRIEWKRVRAGLQAMAQRWPASDGRHMLAYFACMAGDRATYRQASDGLEPQSLWTTWGPDPQRSFEACRRWGTAN